MGDRASAWQLKRQDDNGNQYTVETFDSEEEAKNMLAYYERKGHKQTYWVEESGISKWQNNALK
jgi:hypothetical protein